METVTADRLKTDYEHEHQRYGNNVDESSLTYCCGSFCCWSGVDKEFLKCSFENRLSLCMCSGVNDISWVQTCMACQHRVCCLQCTSVVPCNAQSPVNLGCLGLSVYPRVGCCRQLGQITETVDIPEEEKGLVELNPLPQRYLCGVGPCNCTVWKKRCKATAHFHIRSPSLLAPPGLFSYLLQCC